MAGRCWKAPGPRGDISEAPCRRGEASVSTSVCHRVACGRLARRRAPKTIISLIVAAILVANSVTVTAVELRGVGLSWASDLLEDSMRDFAQSKAARAVGLTYERSGSTDEELLCRLANDEGGCGVAGEGASTTLDFVTSHNEFILAAPERSEYNDIKVFPAMAQAVVPVYNLPDLVRAGLKLTLSMDVLTRIYNCNITNWRDPDILRLNPGTISILPNNLIWVGALARDDSGVTKAFQRRLGGGGVTTDASGENGWPACFTGGQYYVLESSDSASSMSSFILSKPFSLGYLPLGKARQQQLEVAAISNAFGQPVPPSETAIDMGMRVAMPLPQGISTSQVMGSDREQQFLADGGWPIFVFSFAAIRATPNPLHQDESCMRVWETAKFWSWFFDSGNVDKFAEVHSVQRLPHDASSLLARQLLSDIRCDDWAHLDEGDPGSHPLNLHAVFPRVLQSQMQFIVSSYMEQHPWHKVELNATLMSDCRARLGPGETFRVAHCAGLDSSDEDDAAESDESTPALALPFQLHSYVLVANIPGVSELVVDFPALIGILSREVTRFNDPALVALNPALASVDEIIYMADWRDSEDAWCALQALLSDSLGHDVNIDTPTSCRAVSSCLEAAASTPLLVEREPHYVAVVPRSVVSDDFACIIATVKTPDGRLMTSGKESVEACIPAYTSDIKSGALYSEEVSERLAASPSCYPLTSADYIILPGADPAAELNSREAAEATAAVRLWSWALNDSVTTAALGALPTTEALVYTDGDMLAKDVIEQVMYGIIFNDKQAVIHSTDDDDDDDDDDDGMSLGVLLAVVIPGSLLLILLLILALAACLMYRRSHHRVGAPASSLTNNVINVVGRGDDGGNVNKAGEEEWNMDYDSPIVKTLKFLKNLGSSRLDAQRKQEALSLLSKLSGQDGDLTMPGSIQRELSGLSSNASRSTSVSNVLDSMMGRQQAQQISETETVGHRESDFNSMDEIVPLPGAPPPSAIPPPRPIPAVLLSGVTGGMEALPSLRALGRSFFSNVMHLRTCNAQNPLALVTYCVLDELRLIKKLKLDKEKLCSFLLALEEHYSKTNPYHNNWHAADVVQRCTAIVAALPLDRGRATQLHLLGAVIAAACHDLDHPGLDNKYMIRTEDVIARRYNDQHVLENHSLFLTMELLRSEEHNFLTGSRLSQRHHWAKLKHVIIEMVLATDMANHFDLISKFNARFTVVEPNSEAYQETVAANLILVLQMSIKLADLGGCASRLSTHLFWVKCLEQEFFKQGDLERQSGVPCSPLMDRHGPGLMLPSNQLAFSDFMVMPLYKMFANKFPECQPLLDQASANWRYWKAKSMDSIPRVLSLDMDEIVDAMERAQIPGTIVDDAVNHMVETVYKALSSFVRPGEEPPELTASVANKMRQESRRSKLGLLRTTTDLERMSMDMQAQVTGLAEQSGNNAETSGHTTPKSNLANN